MNIKNIAISALILVPLIVVVAVSINPRERAAIVRDEEKRNIISSLAKASVVYKNEHGVYPSNANAIRDRGLLDWVPDDSENYIFKSSEDTLNFIIYTNAESLAWREYCSGETANILYSITGDRTALVCGDPDPNGIRFVN